MDIVKKPSNDKGAEDTKKCYCLPNKEVAKMFFKDVLKREMT